MIAGARSTDSEEFLTDEECDPKSVSESSLLSSKRSGKCDTCRNFLVCLHCLMSPNLTPFMMRVVCTR